MDECISSTVIRCYKSKALLDIEPFYGSRSHGNPFQ